jgi:hypothetical protein
MGKTSKGLNVTIKNCSTIFEDSSLCFIDMLYGNHNIKLDGVYIEGNCEASTLFGEIGGNGNISINNVVYTCLGNVKSNNVYKTMQKNAIIVLDIKSLIVQDRLNSANSYFIGSEFSEVYYIYKTGKFLLEGINPVAGFNQKVTESFLLGKGFQKREF